MRPDLAYREFPGPVPHTSPAPSPSVNSGLLRAGLVEMTAVILTASFKRGQKANKKTEPGARIASRLSLVVGHQGLEPRTNRL